MPRFVSLLRGINVGGHRRLPMADLRDLYQSLGLQRVVSYIQSGNVVFDTTEPDPQALRDRLEGAIAERFGFEVGVLVRSQQQWQDLIDLLPFDRTAADADDRGYLVALLSAAAEPEDAARLEAEARPPERLRVVDDRVYLHCPNGQAGSRMNQGLIEKRLGRMATARNWRTVLKLHALASEP